jgi:hypothetical protein
MVNKLGVTLITWHWSFQMTYTLNRIFHATFC